jgi:hypothetical protein
VRIRHFGFLANCHRAKKLRLCRGLLHAPDEVSGSLTGKMDWPQLLQSLTGKDPFACPACEHGRLIRIEELPPVPDHYSTRAPP